jgi:hypothetical protein
MHWWVQFFTNEETHTQLQNLTRTRLALSYIGFEQFTPLSNFYCLVKELLQFLPLIKMTWLYREPQTFGAFGYYYWVLLRPNLKLCDKDLYQFCKVRIWGLGTHVFIKIVQIIWRAEIIAALTIIYTLRRARWFLLSFK